MKYCCPTTREYTHTHTCMHTHTHTHTHIYIYIYILEPTGRDFEICQFIHIPAAGLLENNFSVPILVRFAYNVTILNRVILWLLNLGTSADSPPHY